MSSFTAAGAAQTAAGAEAASPGSKYSDSTVLSIACGKGVSTDCSMMRWEKCSCGMTNWAVYSASSPVCVPAAAPWGRALCFFSCPSLPRPWPCSVPVVLRGGCTRPGPWRRSSVQAASMHGGVADPPLGGASVCSPRGRPHKVHHSRKATVQTKTNT